MNNKSNNSSPNNNSESEQLLKSWLESNTDCDSPNGCHIGEGVILSFSLKKDDITVMPDDAGDPAGHLEIASVILNESQQFEQKY